MPEEKVKQYQCLCPCEHETGCIACENGNHDYHLVPTAADAGPRQPRSPKDYPQTDAGYARFSLDVARDERLRKAAPPVPQEAAPELGTCYYNSDEHTRNTHGTKFPCQQWVPATAPDWAMRVAGQIWDGDSEAQWQTPEDWIRNAAALIREAGSERERELREALVKLSESARVMVSGHRSGRENRRDLHRCDSCDSNVSDLAQDLAEASRPLGGKS